MTPPRAAAALAVLLLLAACAQPGRYPISGEACGPDDPVRDLHASDCAVAPTPTGSF